MSIQPKDPSKGHFYVSLFKSGIRIGGCAAVIFGLGSVVTLAVAFLVAELLGLVEEVV